MKFVEPSVEAYNEKDPQKKIEHCFRICYRSEDKMKEDSTFLKNILNTTSNKKHYSPLEHFRCCLKTDGRIAGCVEDWQKSKGTRFIDINYYFKEESGNYIIRLTGNMRSWREFIDSFDPSTPITNNKESDAAIARWAIAKELHKVAPQIINEITLPPGLIPDNPAFHINCTYIGEDPDYQTFHIVTCRDVLQQAARHRSLNFSVESTKFINYDKRGFEFCIPRPYDWADIDWNLVNTYSHGTIDFKNPIVEEVVYAAYRSEQSYSKLMHEGCKAQEARMVLPGCAKTEMYLTGTFGAWKHFIELRDDHDANPQIQFIAKLIHEYLDKNHEGWDK